MAWCEFSAEAIDLDTKVRSLHAKGCTSAALEEIKKALRRAHEQGPSCITYERYTAILEASGR